MKLVDARHDRSVYLLDYDTLVGVGDWLVRLDGVFPIATASR